MRTMSEVFMTSATSYRAPGFVPMIEDAQEAADADAIYEAAADADALYTPDDVLTDTPETLAEPEPVLEPLDAPTLDRAPTLGIADMCHLEV